MLNELKTFFSNIKNFRHLLTEGVNSDVIKHAIENHEYLYIYYDGKLETPSEKGYRVIRPYVLGTTQAGNLAVRAFQDRGKSASLGPDARRQPRPDHEFHIDTDGKTKTGWRLFLIKDITSAYPTGTKFNDVEGDVEIPPIYKNPENALLGLHSIIASISKTPERDIQAKYSGTTKQIKPKTTKWAGFEKANVNNRKITSDDIVKLYDIAKKIKKKSPNRFFVSINDRNEYLLQDIGIKPKFPQNAIVGDLVTLYNQLVQPTSISTSSAEVNFAKQTEEKIKKAIENAKNNKK